jgi:hypothetical protein
MWRVECRREEANFEIIHDTAVPGSSANFRASTFSEILGFRASHQGNDRAFVFLDSQGFIAEELTFSELDFRARRISVVSALCFCFPPVSISSQLCSDAFMPVSPPCLSHTCPESVGSTD